MATKRKLSDLAGFLTESEAKKLENEIKKNSKNSRKRMDRIYKALKRY